LLSHSSKGVVSLLLLSHSSKGAILRRLEEQALVPPRQNLLVPARARCGR
jgi:hypothetical protein